jgi:hypothetical protein
LVFFREDEGYGKLSTVAASLIAARAAHRMASRIARWFEACDYLSAELRRSFSNGFSNPYRAPDAVKSERTDFCTVFLRD